ncbi:MAG: sigma-54-dependent Fis family transcriptional regulator [Acidobacteria bacterium]|nr:sigma-54-dependent Fis family transcriptional regulator [Acidobacteriota bacterium]
MSTVSGAGTHVLIVEDDDTIRLALRAALEQQGYRVTAVTTAEDGLARFQRDGFDIAISDVKLPGLSGLDFVVRARSLNPELIVIVMSGGARSVAMEALASGADDFFAKPFRVPELEVVMRRALEKRQLQREVRELRQQLQQRYDAHGLIGDSGRIQEVRALVHKVAGTGATVLIQGESGTGKELTAELIHRSSPRRDAPLIKVNCAAIPESLLESELFGHERGAFTGAVAQKAGKFELANGGTLFLDEVGDMQLAIQAKVLRVLEDREIFRVGGTKPIRVDVRIVAATNKNLEDAVRTREIREDLYHRLNVFPILLPPLRERVEDIPPLVERFLDEIPLADGRTIRGIAPDVMERLLNYSWPGNVRELRNCIERAMIMAEGEIIQLEDLPLRLGSLPSRASTPNGDDLDARLAEQERQWILDALKEVNGVQAHAAKILGITERSLWYRVRKLSLDVEQTKTKER